MASQRQKTHPLVLCLMVFVFGLASQVAYAETCDVDDNGKVDYRDIFDIQVLAMGQAASSPVDTRDADGNGIINRNDVRICKTRCTPAGCPGLTNRRPRALNDSAIAGLNQQVTIDLVANDRDVDGRLALSKLRIVTKPRHGRVTNHRNGTVTYRPARGYLGGDSFRYEIKDNQGAVSNVARVRVTVTDQPPPSGNNPISGSNLPPIANAGTDINAATNTAVTLDGSQSSDPESGQLSFSWQFLTVPTGSTATIANNQSPTPNFTPDVDGVYELVLTVSDGVNANTDTVRVTATTANRPPNIVLNTPNPQPALVGFPITPDISFTVNDNDGPNALALSWSFGSFPVGSTANITNPTPTSASFIPDLVGTYTVRLTAFDGAATSTADVTINADINTPPVANAGADIAVPFPLPPGNNVVLNGTGTDQVVGPDVPLHFTWSFVTVPTVPAPGSTLTNNDITGRLTANPSFTPDSLGEYTLSLTVDDGDPAVVPTPDNVVVKANATPVAVNDSYSVIRDTTLNEPTVSGLLANDTDGNGDDLIIVRDASDTGPTNGTLTLTPPDLENGSFSYVPNPGFEGTDSFTYRVNDRSNILPPYVSNAISAPATVTITVNPPNAAPIVTASGATPSFTENGPPVVAVTIDGGITVTDPDVSDTNLESATVTISNPQDGVAEVLAATACAGLTVTPGVNSLNITGSQPIATYQACLRSVTYSNSSQNPNTTTRIIAFTANDGTANSTPALVNLTVNAVNDRPSFTAATPPAANEDAGAQTVTGWVTNFNPGHPDESAQAVQNYAVTNVSAPTLFAVPPSVDNNGTLSYTPAPNAFGSSTFQVTVQDNGGTSNGGVDTSAPQTFTITVNAVNDAPSFTAINPPAVNEDSGAQTVNAWAAFNPGNALESTQTVSQYIVSNISNSGLFSVLPSVNASGLLTYTPAPNANGTSTFQVAVQDNGGTANGGVDTSPVQTFTITVNAVNDPPVAQNKPASAATNVHTHMKRTGIDAGLLTGITDADSGVNGCLPSFSVASVSVAAGSLGTVSNLDTNTGTFDFEPAANSTAPVTLNYTVQDTGCPGPAQTSAVATISINIIGPKIWFVNSAASPGGNGTLSQPFQTLSAVDAVDAVNDGIFVFTGTYTTSFVLLSGEQLIGQGSTGTTFDALFSITPPTGTIARPVINGTRPIIQNTVTLASSGVVRGLNIASSNVTALTDPVGATTGVSVTEIDVSATNATAVSFNDLTGTVTLGNATSTGGTNNVSLTNVGATVNLGGGALSGSIGTAFDVSGGTGVITYGGTITKANNAQRPVSVANKTGGSVTFTGGITANTGPTLPLGISLTSNTGSTVNVQGGLALSTGANPAFTATGGGTVNVTGAANTLTTTTGTALNVANTTIGADGLTFQSISSNAAANGIILSNTGTTNGGLTVTGTGSAGSGGTIQNSTGTGILLTSTRNVVLNRMNITGSADDGIGGSNLNGFVLDSCSITGNGNTTNADSGVDITNLTGTAIGGTNPTRIVNNTISNSFLFEIGITNTNAGTLTDLQMSGNTLSSNGLQPSHGNLMTLQALGNDTITLNVTSGSFTGNTDTTGGRIVTASGLICDHSGSNGTVTCNVSGATFTTNNVGPEASIGSNSGGTRNTVFNFNNNNIQRSRSHAVNFFADANSPFTKTLSGRPQNNIIGTENVTGSGSTVGFPIRVQNEGRIPVTMAITGNTINESVGFTGINVNHGVTITTGTGATNMTITGNSVKNIDSGRGVFVQQVDMTTANQNAGTLCSDIRSNTFANIVGQGGDGTIIRVRESSNTNVGPHNVTQLSPTATANANELDDANGVTAAQVSLSGTPTFGAGACTQP